MTEKPTIETREDGPLIIKNAQRMVGADGEDIAVKPVMALCRCGGSANKPFCDGSHNSNGFESSGGTPAGRDRIIAYEGAELTVTYNPRLCSHAAECGRLASHVFNPDQKPWIQPDNGTEDEVRAVVAACPSGALALGNADGPEHLVADRADVQIEKNGPYWVTGITAPTEDQAEGASEAKFVLCRCGLSGNKPYCDGSHRDKGWVGD